MNDFERKLRQQPFREPPADLRAAILGGAAKVIVPERWTWREWLWPSPRAWAALAALWLIFLGAQIAERPLSPPAPSAAPASHDSIPLFTFQNTRELRHVLDLAN